MGWHLFQLLALTFSVHWLLPCLVFDVSLTWFIPIHSCWITVITIWWCYSSEPKSQKLYKRNNTLIFLSSTQLPWRFKTLTDFKWCHHYRYLGTINVDKPARLIIRLLICLDLLLHLHELPMSSHYLSNSTKMSNWYFFGSARVWA